ncbi:MAG: cytochrome c biogenesis heme-transporting ATPase CcmA [Marinicellaceae bacterium]
MPIIKATDISCQRGQFILFKPVSFELSPGQSILLSGPNGIGKTTLLEAIAGLRNTEQGKLFYQGIELSQNKDKWFDASFFIGHKTGNKKELTCLENLRLFLQIQGIDVTEDGAEKALENVGLAGYEYQFAGSLSAGQKKRLALARLLIVNHPIWILDEPFVNLDVAGCEWLLNLLQNHLNNNGMLIITAHDNQNIRKFVSQELILEMSE